MSNQQRRIMHRNHFLRSLVNLGVLKKKNMKLEYVPGLKPEDFLGRSLLSVVLKMHLADSYHQARKMIEGGEIIIHKKVITSPLYIVRLASEKLIRLSKCGRVMRKKLAEAAAGGDEEDDVE